MRVLSMKFRIFFWLANNTLLSLRKKFDHRQLAQSDSVIAQILRDGIFVESEPMSHLKNSSKVYFIAHNAVFKPKQKTKSVA